MIRVQFSQYKDGSQLACLSPNLWIVLASAKPIAAGWKTIWHCRHCKTHVHAFGFEADPEKIVLHCKCMTVMMQPPMRPEEVGPLWDSLIKMQNRILEQTADVEGRN